MTRMEQKIPTWAIILAVVFALLCLLGLLFLLVKEQAITGYVEVSVQSGSLYHATQIPVSSQYQIDQVRANVSQAQSLAAAAPR
jgi:hypothetical protein